MSAENTNQKHSKEAAMQKAFEKGSFYMSSLSTKRGTERAFYWLAKALKLGCKETSLYENLIYLYIVSDHPEMISKIKPLYNKLPSTNTMSKKALDAFFETIHLPNGQEKMNLIEKHLSKIDFSYYQDLDRKDLICITQPAPNETLSERFRRRHRTLRRINGKSYAEHYQDAIKKWLKGIKADLIESVPSHDPFYDHQHQHTLLNLLVEAYNADFKDEAIVAKIYNYAEKENATSIKFFMDYLLGRYGNEEAYDLALERCEFLELNNLYKFFYALKTGEARSSLKKMMEGKSSIDANILNTKAKKIENINENMREEFKRYNLYDGFAFIVFIEEGVFPGPNPNQRYLYSILEYPYFSTQLETMYFAAGEWIRYCFDDDFSLAMQVLLLIKNPDFSSLCRDLTNDEKYQLGVKAIQFSQFSFHPKVMKE